MMNRPYGMGHVPDTREKAAAFPMHSPGTRPGHAEAASSESLEGSILDQNRTEGCTGHGSSQWLTVTYARQGKPLPIRPSPRGIYAITREYGRRASTPAGQPLPPLEDSGGMVADLIFGLSACGVRELVMPSPQGYQSDVDPSCVFTEETLAQLEQDMAELVGAARKIDPAGPCFADAVAAAVEELGAVGVGIFADAGFLSYSSSQGPLQRVDLQDPSGGGHWVCITSFRTSAEDDLHQHGIPIGTIIFRGPNSWGSGWGDAGHFEVTEQWLAASCTDCYEICLEAGQ